MKPSFHSRKLHINSFGFSLASTLVAIALIGILIMTVLQLGNMISKQTRQAANLEDLNNLSRQVASILSVPENCRNLYGGERVNLANMGSNASHQLEVVGRKPYSTAGPMAEITSGRMKLKSLGIILRRSLSGTGQPWYQADALIQSKDMTDLAAMEYAPRRVALNVQIDPANKIVNCAGIGSTIIQVTSTSSSLPFGKCGPGQVMVGFDDNGILCAGGAQTVTGTGCTGNACKSPDTGSCYGMNCVTPGNFCDGMNCTACGSAATCKGMNCCTGPTCPGCP
jgi:hypothetical protein